MATLQPAAGTTRAEVQAPPAPDRLDAVPLLRSDLVIARGPIPGTFELRHPGRGPALTLEEYEVSVARMLDGRRCVADVVENGDRLGIPIDADGLGCFIRQLERQGFLAPPGAAPPPGGPRPFAARKVWDARTRERFQRGVRLMRQGRPDEAAPLFRQLILADPDLPEAQEMLALIATGHALVARPIGDVFSTRRGERLMTRGRAWWLAALGLLLATGGGGWAWWTFQAPTAPLQDPAPNVAATPTPAGRRAAPVERRWHPSIAEVHAPAAGQLAWREPAPSRVARGERLGEIRAAAEPSTPGPAARTRLEDLERLASQDPVYQEFVERERATLTGAAGAARSVGLAAPAAGQLSPLARSDARVAAGALLARVVDGDSWRLSVLVRGEPPALGTAWSLSGDAAADLASARVVEVRSRDGQVEVTLAVAAAAAPWLESARAPYLLLPVAGGPVRP